MFLHIVGIQINQVAVFIGLAILDERLIFLKRVIFAVDIFQQCKVLRPLIEILLRQHAIMNKQLQAIPFLLISLAVLLEDALQTIGHLLGDVGRNLLHVRIALQIAAAHVQRNIGRVDHTMQQRQELGHNAFHLVGHKHLITIQLNFIALQLNAVLNAREIQNTRQVERIIHIQMNPKQRLILHGIKLTIELLVILILQRRRRLHPQRLHTVNHVVLVGFHLLAVFPLGFLAKNHGHSHELAIFVEQLGQLALIQKLLAILAHVQHHIRATPSLLGLFKLISRRTIARPFHRLGTFLVRLRDDVHTVAHHEARIETQTKVPNDGIGIILIFIQEIGHTRERNLIDIFLNLLGRHTNAVITNRDGLCRLIQRDAHRQIAQFAFIIALLGQRFQLLRGIDSVAHQLAQKYLMIRIEELFNHGEDVLSRNPNITFLHIA